MFTRNPVEKNGILWAGKTLGDWSPFLEGAEAIVNLRGKSVNCIYTEENKKEIIGSRVDSVRIVDEAIRICSTPPKVLLQAGSLAIYGDTEECCSEDAPHGHGFSVKVCEL